MAEKKVIYYVDSNGVTHEEPFEQALIKLLYRLAHSLELIAAKIGG